MNTKPTFRELFKSARNSIAYKTEGAIIEFTEQIVERMLAIKMSKSDLASKLGSSAPYVTKLLRGGTNFTLESMVKVSDALDSEIRIELVPKFSGKDWINLMEDQNPLSEDQLAWTNMRYKQAHGRESSMLIGPMQPPQYIQHNEICPDTAY